MRSDGSQQRCGRLTGGLRQGVASAQQRVALSTTYRRMNPINPQASRKKGRDGASFGRVLEGLTGQTVLISPFMERHVLFVCVFGAYFRAAGGSHGNAIAECHCSQRLARADELSYSPRQSRLCNILAQILRKK